MQKVRLGIIGVGNMGSSHIKNYLKGAMPEIEISPDKLMIISPDEGATSRAIFLSSVLGVNMGMC